MRALIILFAAITLHAQAFDVASVKPVQGNFKEGPRETIDSPPGSLTMRSVTLRTCLRWAYDVKDYQIAGPGWLGSEQYDIVAKAAEGAPADQMKLMLRTLLADRFKLTLHRESRDLPVYVMVPGKNGLKLQESKSSGAPSQKFNEGTVLLTNHTTQELAERLSGKFFGLSLPVLDHTGATGRYDVNIELASSMMEMKMAIERSQMNPDPTPVAQALQKVGIKLENQKAPVEVLVIDRAEKVPTEN